ncbi:hypothetical protein VPNG_01224 [Cytospora leucostoma]|uniref:Ketoreductase (KR) domain-containing protein n=1 Tax=Cytospora leucostoma TaxID=1230097 RepID=A0A423XLC6_9PEZI|nr:hypothetical protein VPNG_01224 [Cytospora leucostoma]
MSPNTVLITGANRGLGLGLTQRFLKDTNNTVIAAVRSPEHETTKALSDLPKGSGSKLIVAKYDATVEQDAFDLVKELKEKHGIKQLDTVIANAGTAKLHPLVKDVKRQDIQEHIELNAYSVVSLYQATRQLLQSSAKPVFAPMGSGAGSLGRQPLVPNAAYGPSKALLPWYAIRINAEDEWLTTFVLDPGFVQTDTGNSAARVFGMKEAPTAIDESTDGLYKVITTATRKQYGGKVVLYTGEVQVY